MVLLIRLPLFFAKSLRHEMSVQPTQVCGRAPEHGLPNLVRLHAQVELPIKPAQAQSVGQKAELLDPKRPQQALLAVQSGDEFAVDVR